LKIEGSHKKIAQPKTNKNENNNIFENGRQPHFFLKGRQPQKEIV
jgi:hypothetical protein